MAEKVYGICATNKCKKEVVAKEDYDLDYLTHTKQIGEIMDLQTATKYSLVDAINEVFRFANNGKNTLASAIGNGASASMEWDELASKMNQVYYETSNDAKGVFKRRFKYIKFWIIFSRVQNTSNGGASYLILPTSWTNSNINNSIVSVNDSIVHAAYSSSTDSITQQLIASGTPSHVSIQIGYN